MVTGDVVEKTVPLAVMDEPPFAVMVAPRVADVGVIDEAVGEASVGADGTSAPLSSTSSMTHLSPVELFNSVTLI